VLYVLAFVRHIPTRTIFVIAPSVERQRVEGVTLLISALIIRLSTFKGRSSSAFIVQMCGTRIPAKYSRVQPSGVFVESVAAPYGHGIRTGQSWCTHSLQRWTANCPSRRSEPILWLPRKRPEWSCGKDSTTRCSMSTQTNPSQSGTGGWVWQTIGPRTELPVYRVRAIGIFSANRLLLKVANC